MATIDPASRIERLLAAAEPAFRDEFLSVVALVRRRSTLERIATLLERGDAEGALRDLDRIAGRLGVVWSERFIVAGRAGAEFLGRRVEDVIIAFDQTNFRAVEQMSQNQLRLVREFTRGQREATREALLDGIRRGANPIEQARAFRDSIGLTAHQQRAVQNYRRSLEDLDSSVALQRQLRDRRFDPSIRRAISDGKPLTGAQVDRMVGRYRERALRHRSEVIARTESLRSVHQGTEEVYRQAIDAGELQPDQLARTWNTALDERVRGSHKTMHGQVRPVNEPFVSGDGNLLQHPGDPQAPGSETIQCRCAVSTRIASPGEVPGLVGVSVLEER